MTTRLIAGTMITAMIMGMGADTACAGDKTFKGLTSDQLQKNADKYGKEYRPKEIKAYVEGKEARYDIVWEQKAGGGWVMYQQLTQEDFTKEKKELGRQKFSLTLESEYKVQGTTYYWAVWYEK